MKKLILLCLFLAAVPIIAQNSGQYTSVRSGLALPSTCDQTKGPIFLLQNDGLYQGVGSPCVWQKVSAGGGGGGGLTGVITVTSTIQNAVSSAGTNQGVVIPPTYTGTDQFTNGNNRPILDLRRLGDFRGGKISVLDFGADPTAGYYWNTSMTSGTSTVTNVYYAGLNKAGGVTTVNSAKVGERFCVSGAGVAGADLCGHVVTNNNAYPATITLDVTASTTVTNRGSWWGNDSSTAFQAAITACTTSSYSVLGGCEVDAPPGQYLLGTTVNFSANDNLISGRQTLRCGGRGNTKLIWTGADQTAILHAPSSSVPVEVTGCYLTSGDYTAGAAYSGRRAAIGFQFDSGNGHRLIDNKFGDLYEGIRGTNSWLHLIDNNLFYGQYHASIYFPSAAHGGTGPINSTTISNNEFGFYHQYGYLNESNGSGGSNGNFVFGNDFEGTATDTIADVDDVSNWDTFGPNRFETSGSTVVGYSPLILRGAFKNVYMTFCGGIQILGTDNTISCSSAVSPSTPVTDGGFNVWMGQIPRSAGVATSSTIVGSNRQGVMIDANGKADLGTGNGLTGTHPGPWLKLNGKDFRTHTAQETNPNYPTCSSTNETFNVRDVVWNDYAAGAGFGAYDQVYAWMCVNNSGCGCNPPVASDWKELGELRTKMTREGTAAPVSGNWNVGDFIRNTNTAGTNPVYGWLCTVAGTPGTWVALTAINPASPPNFGTTTPAIGAFTTVSATSSASVGTNLSVNGGSTVGGTSTSGTFNSSVSSVSPSLVAGGPVAWYKADDGTSCTVDGTSVTSWADSSGNGHAATNLGTAPICKLSIVNGKPVIRFAGTGILQNQFTLPQPITVFVVYQKAIGSNAGLYLYDGGSPSCCTALLAFKDNTGAASASSMALYGGATYRGGTILDDGAFHIAGGRFNAASSTLAQDGTSITISSSPGTATTGGVTIAGAGNNGARFTGDVAEVIVYSSALSTTDFSQVEYYLSTKYNRTVTDPPVPYNSGAGFKVDIAGKVTANGASEGLCTVTFSATPTFSASSCNTFKLTLTGNVTSSTLSNAVAGQPLNFIFCQDATGSRTLAWPANVFGEGTITATANKCSSQSFKFDGTNAYATGPMVDQDANVSAATYKAGSNNVTQTIASGTATLNTAAIASGVCDTVVTVSATGVVTTDTVTFTPNTDPSAVTGYAPSASGSLYIWAWAGSGSVNFKQCNNTAGSITPSALTLNWRVSR